MRSTLTLTPAAVPLAAWLLLAAPPPPGAAAGGQGDIAPSPQGEGASVPAASDSAAARRFPPPDPRAFRDTSLTYEEQSERDRKFRAELRRAPIDTMPLNHEVVLALHAAPAAEHRTAVEVAALARDCEKLVTAVPPGDWDVFLIVSRFDLVNGIMVSFDWPDDWVVRGFTLNPQLATPFVLGNLKSSDVRPYLVAFDCVARADRASIVPEGALSTTGDLLVIGCLELTASSPGSLAIANHSNMSYGSPEVANCSRRTMKVPALRRGRIDVGQGPGLRPCTGGVYGVPDPPKAASQEGENE